MAFMNINLENKNGWWVLKRFPETDWFINELRSCLNLDENQLLLRELDEEFVHLTCILSVDENLKQDDKKLKKVSKECSKLHKKFRTILQKSSYKNTDKIKVFGELLSKSKFLNNYYKQFTKEAKEKTSFADFTKSFWNNYDKTQKQREIDAQSIVSDANDFLKV